MDEQTYRRIVRTAAVGLLSLTLAEIRELPAGSRPDLRLVWDKARDRTTLSAVPPAANDRAPRTHQTDRG